MIRLFNSNAEIKFENELLKDKVKDQDDLLFKITQENAHLSDKVEELQQQREINEILETDKPLDNDYYGTKELDKKQYFSMVDKLSSDRDTYKEVINVMCDKYNISHDSVLNIIDDISQNKGVEIERV